MRLIDAGSLKMFIKEYSYPVRYDINSVEKGMTLTGILECIDKQPTVHKVSDGIVEYKRAIELMAEYIVTLGRVDYHLCDEIPKEIHLKHQPQNDGNYENESCFKCVAEYFLNKAGEQ